LTNGFPTSYIAVERLGQGGFGEVWWARRRRDDHTCVVKMPRAPYTEDELWRFQREVRIQSQLEHPNIVPILDFDLNAMPPWFVMPKADMNLNDALARITTTEALDLFIQCSYGVAYAHKNRVLHRDLKPANVLLFSVNTERSFRAAVTDFGLGRTFTRDTPLETATGVRAGTPWYAAPEQLVDFKLADQKADVYGLGRILQYILGFVPANDQFGQELRRKLEYCITRSTAQDPNNRYHSVEMLLADVRLILEQPEILERPEDMGLALVQGILELGDFSANSTAPLAQLLFEHRDDYRLIVGLLPRLPDPILRSLFTDHVEPLQNVLLNYVAFLREPLATDYALSACKVLEAIYEVSGDSRVRIIAAENMISIAAKYDLWEVGYLVARIIGNERNPEILMELRQFFSNNTEEAKWCEQFVRKVNMPAALRRVIRA
jgi:serine/threonine protein kinase